MHRELTLVQTKIAEFEVAIEDHRTYEEKKRKDLSKSVSVSMDKLKDGFRPYDKKLE